MASSTEIVQVINRGNAEFTIRWGGVPYHLPPDGVPRAIPVDAVKATCGDWDAKDTDHDAKRSEWRKMLNVRYGLLNAPWYSDQPIKTVGLTNDTIPEPIEDYTAAPEALVESRYQFMHPNLPRLEVRDFDGNRIYTVIDDPDGDLVNGRRQAIANDGSTSALIAAIKAKDEQIDRLIAAMAASSPEQAAVLAAERNTPGVALSTPSDPLDSPTQVHPAAPEDNADALAIMDAELGLAPADSPVAAVKKAGAKKAAAKKAAAPAPVEIGDEL